MYILLDAEGRTAAEIIPENDPVFPGVPIEGRYTKSFIEKLKKFPDDTEVQPGWIYDGAGFYPEHVVLPEDVQQDETTYTGKETTDADGNIPAE